MKLIIAGGRDLNINEGLMNGLILFYGLEEEITEIVHGDATGVDEAGKEWGLTMKYLCGDHSMVITPFEADWTTYGRPAGPMRNKQMAEYSDALLLIWNGKSSGSASMKREMQKLNKPIYEVTLKGVSNG